MENNYSNNHTENTFQESIPSLDRALLDSSKNNFDGPERQSVRRLSRMSLFCLAIAILLAIMVASDLVYIKSLNFIYYEKVKEVCNAGFCQVITRRNGNH